MQKLHPIVAGAALALLAVHLSAGCVTLLTSVFLNQGPFAYVFMAAVGLHVLLALAKLLRGAGREMLRYPKENARYWARLGSGAAILLLIFPHTQLFTVHTPFGVLLKDFGVGSLLWQLLLTAALAVHVFLNLTPLLIDAGLPASGRLRRALFVLFAALFAAAALGAVCYFAGVRL